MAQPARRRLLVQYLEPSPAVESLAPAEARDRLARALDRLPVTDLALGWRLSPALASAILAVVPSDVTVWRWVPVFVDSGEGRAVDSLVAIGPAGAPPAPFRGMADFRFLCLDQDEVIEAGLSRALELAREVEAHGVMLDRIRWHSPSKAPAGELTCFCERSRLAAARDGLDLRAAAEELGEMERSLAGRRALVGALLGRSAPGALADFLAWRNARVSTVVGTLAAGLAGAGLRIALDVFTPGLAPSVGQELATLGRVGEWTKSMTYFDALGPASMPYELRAYAAWLEELGEDDAAGFMAGLLGFDPPAVSGDGPQIEAVRLEVARLVSAAGRDRAIVGIDAVEIAGVCVVDADDLDARVRAVWDAGVGLSPSWELRLIGDDRIRRIADVLVDAWAGGQRS